MNPAIRSHNGLAAFTLIEVILAVGIASVVLVAIGSVFFGSMRLRSRVIERTQQVLPVDRAIATIKRDLLGIIPPGNLAGSMGTDVTVVGMTQPLIMELFTTTGAVGDDVPWGDVQRIDYWLLPSTNRDAAGKDLIRGVTRNLLASIPEAPEQHRVIGNVENLRFSCFDGTNWNESWSTSLSNVPVAIKVFLTFATPRGGQPVSPPVQFLVPVVTQVSTNQTNAISN